MDYFKSYDFILNDKEELINAFGRLCIEKKWNKNKTKKEKKEFINIISNDLNDKYNKLEHFQDLCIKLLNNKPNTITQCKKTLKSVYVNIWDIVDEKYNYFTNYKDFKKYTFNGKTFSRKEAKKLNLNVFLKKL